MMMSVQNNKERHADTKVDQKIKLKAETKKGVGIRIMVL